MSQDLCAECYMPVRPRQEGLQCDICFTWQHRTCNTGISQREYRNAVKLGQDIDWHCKCCTRTGGDTIPGNDISANDISANDISASDISTVPVAMSTLVDEVSCLTGWLLFET